MNVWLVECEDLTSVWSSYEKALTFMHGEAERCGWKYRGYDHEDPEDANLFYFTGNDGNFIEFYIYKYTVDAKPYLEN